MYPAQDRFPNARPVGGGFFPPLSNDTQVYAGKIPCSEKVDRGFKPCRSRPLVLQLVLLFFVFFTVELPGEVLDFFNLPWESLPMFQQPERPLFSSWVVDNN